MKDWASILTRSALALVCACGGGGEGGLILGPPGLNITGNWQFSTTSTVPGMPPVTIAGSITQSGSAGSTVKGAVHVDGSNCFDRLTTIGLTGTLTGSHVSLTSTPVDGQVITLAGSFTGTDNAFTGSYSTNGGCGNGDQGDVTGLRVPAVNGIWRSSVELLDVEPPADPFENGERCHLIATMSQSSVSSEGSFSITGPVRGTRTVLPGQVTGAVCLMGTIIPGTFPSPSFIMGTSVALAIETADGTVVFQGTVNEAGNIIGSFDRAFGMASFGRVP